MAFDVQAAKKAGYSDAEIADFLGQSSGFDVSGARSSGYTDADILGHLASAPARAPAAKPKRSLYGEVAGAMANVNRGLGIGDELVAGAKTAGNIFAGKTALADVPQDFRRSMADQRQLEDGFAADRPNVAALARGTGMAATVAVPGGNTANLFAQGGRIANAARGATTAGLTGAAYAAADRGTVSERIGAASRTARDPVTLGLGAVGGALATARPIKAKPAPAMSVDKLRAEKAAAYKAADDAGVAYAPPAFDGLVAKMERRLQNERVNPMRHPKAASMLDDIQKMRGGSPSLTELDQLRQVVSSDVAGAADKSERRLGRAMIDEIDQFIANAGPADVISGNAPDAAQTIKRARDLHTRLAKIDSVTTATEKARLRAGSTGSGGNEDNAIRQNLRGVLERGRNFSDDEAAALESIVMGGKGQNLLRLVGKLSPSGNGLMAAGNLAAAAAGGPLGAIPGAAGLISKLAADGLTRRKVTELIELMARGGAAAKPVATGLSASRLPPAAAARASRAAGVATGAAARRPTVEAWIEDQPEVRGASYGSAGSRNIFAGS